MDLIPGCTILFSNILTVAETHRKHVPHINPNYTVLYDYSFYLGLIMVTCLEKKEREREGEYIHTVYTMYYEFECVLPIVLILT